MEVRCQKCGLWQDPGLPTCPHLRGRKGGLFNAASSGHEALAERGRKGAAAAGRTRDQLRELGKRGGLALRDSRGYNYYAEIGRKGAITRNKQVAEERAIAELLGEETK